MSDGLREISPEDLLRQKSEVVDPETEEVARKIVADVRARGVDALREYAEQFDGLEPAAKLIYSRADLEESFQSLSKDEQDLLQRTASRIETFAKAQRESVAELEYAIRGGKAGHFVRPMSVAGCYAPGGRFPLPSSVLMTAVTARVAGVDTVIVSSPGTNKYTMAAAYLAEADLYLAAGGAQAVAAMAYGVDGVPASNIIVGPGNRYVTAAKKLVMGDVAIDMLAGPSELLVIADATANPAWIAADLLAQAEHDSDAIPMLISTDNDLIEKVNQELGSQLANLDTSDTAGAALKNGFVVSVNSIEEAIKLSDQIAAEHLQLMLENSEEVASKLNNFGALFIGSISAEVFGDYGVGPNHVLPTAGTAKYSAGLSVFNFLRFPTWLEMEEGDEASEIAEDARDLAKIEGLTGHARAAAARLKS